MRGVGEPLGAQEVHVPHQKLRGDGEASPVDEQAVQKRKAEDKLIYGGANRKTPQA